MGDLIKSLQDTGKAILAFDAFSHGTTGRGRHGWRQSSLIELSDLVLAIDREHGPFEAVVAHSAGAPAVARALRTGMPISKVVFLAPLADPLAQTHVLSEALGFDAVTAARWPEVLLERFNATREDIDMRQPLPLPAPEVLIFHDQDDAFSPVAGSHQLRAVWHCVTLVETEGLGHYRITKDSEVLAQLKEFLSAHGSVPQFHAT